MKSGIFHDFYFVFNVWDNYIGFTTTEMARVRVMLQRWSNGTTQLKQKEKKETTSYKESREIPNKNLHPM